ncbi:MAG: hypothetical protein Q4G46_08465 [Propionibacteriaceae bacterium]|nr:hypothetical protein [Propionibacteriaceae bacterium]
MSVLVEARRAERVVTVSNDRAGRHVTARRRVRTAPVGRAMQPQRLGRPAGVPGPEVMPAIHPAAAVIPPPVLDAGIRLTDRGLALVMGLIVALVLASLVCIGTTAVRVTADPAPGAQVAVTD